MPDVGCRSLDLGVQSNCRDMLGVKNWPSGVGSGCMRMVQDASGQVPRPVAVAYDKHESWALPKSKRKGWGVTRVGELPSLRLLGF